MKEGRGEYYRELQAPQRTLVQTTDGNWEARWLDHGRPDHYARCARGASGSASGASCPITTPGGSAIRRRAAAATIAAMRRSAALREWAEMRSPAIGR